MERKEENIYPILPTAPPIEDQGQGYRLQKINEIQTFLENFRWWGWRCCLVLNGDRDTRSHSDRRSGAFTGFLSIIGKYSLKKSPSKAEKHEKIKRIASAKLDTIASHISKALNDNKVTDEEFQLILEES